MTEAFDIQVDQVTPATPAILAGQGIPRHRTIDDRTTRLVEEAAAVYRRLARPRAVVRPVSRQSFTEIYRGEGMNEPQTPLEEIVSRSTELSLFAVTIGQEICEEINRLFDADDLASGAMLDAAASAGTDLAAETVEHRHQAQLRTTGTIDAGGAVLRFSPGYCGWHVSGQKRLFAELKPQKIDLTLRESCLMQPLKSISGVLVAGPKIIFDIDDTYPFCAACKTHSCRDRYQALSDKYV